MRVSPEGLSDRRFVLGGATAYFLVSLFNADFEKLALNALNLLLCFCKLDLQAFVLSRKFYCEFC